MQKGKINEIKKWVEDGGIEGIEREFLKKIWMSYNFPQGI